MAENLKHCYFIEQFTFAKQNNVLNFRFENIVLIL